MNTPNERAIDGGFEIGIGEKDVGRLAAEFERDALHRVGRLLHDDLAHGGAAREGDLVHVGMLHQRRAGGLAKAGDDVDDAGRKTDFGKPVCEFERGERSLLGGLQHAGASRGQRGSQLPRGHQQRIVPRNDLPGDADRLFQRQAHRVVGNGIDEAEDLGGEAAVIFEAGGGVVDVVLGFDDGLAACCGHSSSASIGQVLADFVGQTEQYAATLLRGGGCPRAVFEGGFGGGDCAIHVFGVRVGHLRDDFFRGRIVDRERFSPICWRPIRR